MPIDAKELMEAAEIVARDKNMKVTLKCTAGAGIFTGLTTMIAGMVAGPFGFIIGALFGGVTSAAYTQNQFKTVVEIIRTELTPAQRHQLVEHLRNAVQDFGITDMISITTLVMTNDALYSTIFHVLNNFVTNELHHQLKA